MSTSRTGNCCDQTQVLEGVHPVAAAWIIAGLQPIIISQVPCTSILATRGIDLAISVWYTHEIVRSAANTLCNTLEFN
jgi:hypothetical protein